jgi:hypothetical protein
LYSKLERLEKEQRSWKVSRRGWTARRRGLRESRDAGQRAGEA